MGQPIDPPDTASLAAILAEASFASAVATPASARFLMEDGTGKRIDGSAAVLAMMGLIEEDKSTTVRTSQFSGFVGDGVTSCNAGITALLAKVAAIGPTADRRVTIIFDSPKAGCVYAFTSAFRIPIHCDVRTVGGVKLKYTGTGYGAAAVSVGQSTDSTTGAGTGVFFLPEITCSTKTTHRNSGRKAVWPDLFSGYRLELCNAWVFIPSIDGFSEGVQIRPEANCFASGNRVTIGKTVDCFVHADFQSNTSAQVNDNTVIIDQVVTTSSFALSGNAFGARFGAVAAGYDTSSNGNVVRIGRAKFPTPTLWTAGMTAAVGDWVSEGGRLLECKTAGTADATPPADGSGNTDVADGTILWTRRRKARRSLVLSDGFSGRNYVSCERIDTCYGDIVTMGFWSPDTSGAGLVVDVGSVSGATVPGNTTGGLLYGIEPYTHTAYNLGSAAARVRVGADVTEWTTQLPPLITSFVGHGSNTATLSHGYVFLGADASAGVPRISSTSAPFVLCRDGVRIGGSISNDLVGAITPMTPESGAMTARALSAQDVSNPPRVGIVPLTTAGVPIAPASTTIGIVSNNTIALTTGVLRPSQDSFLPTHVVREDAAIGAVFSGWNNGKVHAVSVTRRLTNFVTPGLGASALSIDTALSPPVRAAAATPTLGYFPQRTRVMDSTGASQGWDCYGWLAPAWATGATVYPLEIRTAGGNAYCATNVTTSATTGATTPTGTDAANTVSDGTVAWLYVGPAGSVTAVTGGAATLANSAPTVAPVTVGTSSAQVLAANASGQKARLRHVGTSGAVWLRSAGGTATNADWVLYPGDEFAPPFPFSNAWTAIAEFAGTVCEIEYETQATWEEPVRVITCTNGSTTGSAEALVAANAAGQYVMFRNTSDKTGGTPAVIRYLINGTAGASSLQCGPGGIVDRERPMTTNFSIFGSAASIPYCLVTAV